MKKNGLQIVVTLFEAHDKYNAHVLVNTKAAERAMLATCGDGTTVAYRVTLPQSQQKFFEFLRRAEWALDQPPGASRWIREVQNFLDDELERIHPSRADVASQRDPADRENLYLFLRNAEGSHENDVCERYITLLRIAEAVTNPQPAAT